MKHGTSKDLRTDFPDLTLLDAIEPPSQGWEEGMVRTVLSTPRAELRSSGWAAIQHWLGILLPPKPIISIPALFLLGWIAAQWLPNREVPPDPPGLFNTLLTGGRRAL